MRSHVQIYQYTAVRIKGTYDSPTSTLHLCCKVWSTVVQQLHSSYNCCLCGTCVLVSRVLVFVRVVVRVRVQALTVHKLIVQPTGLPLFSVSLTVDCRRRERTETEHISSAWTAE